MCVSFILGYKFSNPKIEEPKKIIKTKKKKRKKDEFEYDDITRIMLENIDNYDGTANGQQDVPEEDEEVL